MLRIRTTTYVLFGILVAALITAVLIIVLKPLEAKGEENKGGIPHFTPTVSSVETSVVGIPSISVQSTGTPTLLKGRRITKRAGGYSLILPDGWVDRNSSSYDAFLALSSSPGEGDPPWFRVQASLEFTSAKWLENYVGSPGSIRPEYIDVELAHNVEVASWEWQRFVTADAKDEARQLYIFTDREGGGFYLLHAVIWTKDWDLHLPIFEGIIASFAFERIETPPPVTPTQVPTSTPKPH